jgi:hypothetical protein
MFNDDEGLGYGLRMSKDYASEIQSISDLSTGASSES